MDKKLAMKLQAGDTLYVPADRCNCEVVGSPVIIPRDDHFPEAVSVPVRLEGRKTTSNICHRSLRVVSEDLLLDLRYR